MTSAGPFDNGLHAPAYVPLTDVDPMIGQHLLTALGRARIAAYLVPTEAAARQRLYVASEERVDARTIVVAAVRALSDDEPAPPVPADPLAGLDTDSEFHALIADWKIDTVAAIREAERDLTREDADWRARLIKPQSADEVWLDEDHYVPPEPPPLPRLAAPTIIAMLVLAGSIVFLALGDRLGLGDGFTLVLGILGLLLGVGILFTRVRDHYRDEDDDGAAI